MFDRDKQTGVHQPLNEMHTPTHINMHIHNTIWTVTIEAFAAYVDITGEVKKKENQKSFSMSSKKTS